MVVIVPGQVGVQAALARGGFGPTDFLVTKAEANQPQYVAHFFKGKTDHLSLSFGLE